MKQKANILKERLNSLIVHDNYRDKTCHDMDIHTHIYVYRKVAYIIWTTAQIAC